MLYSRISCLILQYLQKLGVVVFYTLEVRKPKRRRVTWSARDVLGLAFRVKCLSTHCKGLACPGDLVQTVTSQSISPCGWGNPPSSQSGAPNERPVTQLPSPLPPPPVPSSRCTLCTHGGLTSCRSLSRSPVRAGQNRPRCGAADYLVHRLTAKKLPDTVSSFGRRRLVLRGSCGACVRADANSLRPDRETPATYGDGRSAARQGCVILGTSFLRLSDTH